MKHLSFLLLLLCSIAGTAAAQDTLWVRRKEERPVILHKVKSGETLFMLAKRYSVPPAVLADINHMSYNDGLAPGSRITIPVDQYNFIREQNARSRPIYYKANDADELTGISHMFHISQSTVQRWNNMTGPDIAPGRVLQVGWISFDKDQIPFPPDNPPAATTVTGPAPKTAKPAPAIPAVQPGRPAVTAAADSTAPEEETAFARLYEQQTMGASLTEEAGAAVFYPLRTKAAEGTYYAFHNTALRGTILKISNPANGKTVYAKVIGPIPTLKEYHNSIVGLSSNAAAVLQAREKRMFCNVQYR